MGDVFIQGIITMMLFHQELCYFCVCTGLTFSATEADACEAGCATYCDSEQQQLSLGKKPRNILPGLKGVMTQCINSKQRASALSVNVLALRKKLIKSLKAIIGQDLSFRTHPKDAF